MRAAERAHHAAGGRRDVDHASELLRLHRRQRSLDEQERRSEVHVQRGSPLVGIQIGESRRERASVTSPGTANARSPNEVATSEARWEPRTLTATDAPRSYRPAAAARPS